MYNTFGTNVTLYHYDGNKWLTKHLNGVSWHGGQAATVGDGGLKTADKYTVRIPSSLCTGYVKPESYNGAEGTWTIDTDDIVVKGTHADISTKAEGTSHTDSFIVTGVFDNRRGLPFMQHIRLEGK